MRGNPGIPHMPRARAGRQDALVLTNPSTDWSGQIRKPGALFSSLNVLHLIRVKRMIKIYMSVSRFFKPFFEVGGGFRRVQKEQLLINSNPDSPCSQECTRVIPPHAAAHTGQLGRRLAASQRSDLRNLAPGRPRSFVLGIPKCFLGSGRRDAGLTHC